jgi:3'-phosphoadenosine 5'-phosphosulfate (PAPS) 3'-phosphatase
MKHFISACLKDAGQVLLEHLSRGCPARLKENQSSVVTDADLASEELIVARIRALPGRRHHRRGNRLPARPERAHLGD